MQSIFIWFSLHRTCRGPGLEITIGIINKDFPKRTYKVKAYLYKLKFSVEHFSTNILIKRHIHSNTLFIISSKARMPQILAPLFLFWILSLKSKCTQDVNIRYYLMYVEICYNTLFCRPNIFKAVKFIFFF